MFLSISEYVVLFFFRNGYQDVASDPTTIDTGGEKEGN